MRAEEFRGHALAGTVGHVGLRQSMSMLVDGLGWRLDRYEETIEPVIAARDTETGLGMVQAGGVIGQRQTAIGTVAGKEVASFDLEMSAGAQPIDSITITGEPTVRQVIEGGINGDTGTEAMIVNLVPVVASAAPGLLTMRDLYPVTCRIG
jgi:4-hydroxy-tetrahydrodipicolinate reductase